MNREIILLLFICGFVTFVPMFEGLLFEAFLLLIAGPVTVFATLCLQSKDLFFLNYLHSEKIACEIVRHLYILKLNFTLLSGVY